MLNSNASTMSSLLTAHDAIAGDKIYSLRCHFSYLPDKRQMALIKNITSQITCDNLQDHEYRADLLYMTEKFRQIRRCRRGRSVKGCNMRSIELSEL